MKTGANEGPKESHLILNSVISGGGGYILNMAACWRLRSLFPNLNRSLFFILSVLGHIRPDQSHQQRSF